MYVIAEALNGFPSFRISPNKAIGSGMAGTAMAVPKFGKERLNLY